MRIINIIMQQQARKQAHRHLPAPLPIQSRQPLPTNSLLSFVQDQNQQQIFTSPKDVEQLYPVFDRFPSKKNIHQIGDSLPQLFSSPIYKCHQGLKVANNQEFCSWSTDQNYRINATHNNYDASQETLLFQSKFESGNLGLVSQVQGNPRAYYLALQRDVNSSSGTTQWFYFRVNPRGNVGNFTFHVVNFVKPFSMFKIGMKPCIYSLNRSPHWQRGGNDIEYRRNSILYQQSQNYYTLSFTYQFQGGQSQVYFAYCYPYTYSRLQTFLNAVEAKHSDKLRRKTIAKTLGGNAVELLSITNPQILNKRLLYITARVHPGQTVSSFVCEAMILFLLSNDSAAQKMRNQFIIKIVPMLNPDGVINGSYRCSLAGVDLNRQWRNPSKILHPQIYNIKKIILQSEYKKLLFLDIHGHSKKKASFMYGCVSTRSPYISKQLPYLLSRRMSHFNYYTCNFAMPKSKEGTSRITLWRNGIENSYTYEVSFCGPQKQKRHFSINDIYTLGLQLCRGLYSYFYSRILQLQVDQELNRHCEQFYNDQQLLNLGNEQTDGSSSQLQDQRPQQNILTKINSRMLKKVQRSHNATEKTQSSRLNDLLEQYMIKRSKPNKELQEQLKQKIVQKQIYSKQRQSFMVTRVNLQQIQSNQPMYSNLSTYYGFGAERAPPTIQERSSSLRNSAQIMLKHGQHKQKGQSFGILLPNVQKNQYKRYQRKDRYNRRQKNQQDRSVSVYVQHLIKNKSSESRQLPSYLTKINRQISLGQRIRSRIMDNK